MSACITQWPGGDRFTATERRLIGMLDRSIEESARRALTPWDGFRRITGRVNVMTGEMVDIDPPIMLHGEDADAWFDSWIPIDVLDYKIRLARLAQAGAR